MQRSRLRSVPIAFETKSLKADGYIRSIFLQGVFIRATRSRLPTSGEAVQIEVQLPGQLVVGIDGLVVWTTAEPSQPPSKSGFQIAFESGAELLELFEPLLLS